MIKVGLIGGGGIADAHIKGYRAYSESIAVTAVADVVYQTASRRAAELSAVGYTDFRQMILDADLTPWTSACRTTSTRRRSSPLLQQEDTSCARSRSA
jgi:hypothetical protein